jgi:hypothetical protein
MFDALATMKANSPTGASGMGTITDKDASLLQAVEGSLGLASPLSTARTLIQVIDQTPGVIEGQRAAFNSAFGGGTGAEKKATAKEPSKAGTPKKAVYDLNGNRIQ